jgi:hypothetical protein
MLTNLKMLVDRYKIRLPEDNSTGKTINIPIDMTFQLVDQAEIIERDFVKNEVEAAINPILDYEKVRFEPARNISANFVIPIPIVVYTLNFLSGSTQPPTGYYQNPSQNNATVYGNIGFTNDDIKFRKNGLVKSILRLEFYDSDILTNQRLLFFLNLRPKVTANDVAPPSTSTPYVQSYSANRKLVSFTLSDTSLNSNGDSNGYNLYDYKDEVAINAPKEIYMRAVFNNAKTGIRTRFMTDYDPTSIAWPIDIFVDKIFTKYVLHKTILGYYYAIDTNYSTNVATLPNTPNTYVVNLYEVAVI